MSVTKTNNKPKDAYTRNSILVVLFILPVVCEKRYDEKYCVSEVAGSGQFEASVARKFAL